MEGVFDPRVEEYRVKAGSEWYTCLDYQQVLQMMRITPGPCQWLAVAAPEGQHLFVRSTSVEVIRRTKK